MSDMVNSLDLLQCRYREETVVVVKEIVLNDITAAVNL
jgi:hypothetical protein